MCKGARHGSLLTGGGHRLPHGTGWENISRELSITGNGTLPEVGSELGPSLRGQQGDHVAGDGEETRGTKERNRDDHQEGKAAWPAVAVIREGPGHQLWRSHLTVFQMEWETERLGSDGSSGNTAPNTVLTSREEVRENTERNK